MRLNRLIALLLTGALLTAVVGVVVMQSMMDDSLEIEPLEKFVTQQMPKLSLVPQETYTCDAVEDVQNYMEHPSVADQFELL